MPEIKLNLRSNLLRLFRYLSAIILNYLNQFRKRPNIKTLALKLYTFLVGMFASVNIRLIECQLEFGRINNLSGDIILLADEITPDTCKL
ncbi:SAICAR synthetase family protein [Orientia tsutsugamushi str. TA716]|uniref:SAICAR synthetase family protein n=1 Tax=Orientia tsutsugamushi str. TA716 TaxID=1359175 RepID=A0A0F3NR88_ORITS|nr:SAICAR synthetase family protein [Orientia tsutsugamushi str. TA716]